MPSRAPARTALGAVLSFLSPLAVPAHADATLAVSGSYTLTGSLVDADASYLGWAAGRTLTPGERQQLAALDVARFQRDPAWVVRTLNGEQKNLPSFLTLPTQVQSDLRRTVLKDIPDFQASHLTPDEARRMQQIVSGTDTEAASAPAIVTGTAHPRMSVPASPSIPASRPGTAATSRPLLTDARLPFHNGRYTLTQAMVNDDLTIWQLVAGRPLAPGDRRAVAAVDVSQFHHDPAWVTTNLRQVHKDLPRVQSQNAAERANLRQENIVNLYCRWEEQHLTPEEAAQARAVIGRYVDVVGVDPDKKVVVTGQDIDAWVAATRFIAAQAHVAGPGKDYKDALVQLARHPSNLGDLVEADAGDMERNWAALHLLWPRLTAAQRTQALGKYLAKIKQASAGGHALDLESAVALQSSRNVFDQDYLAQTDPRLARYKLMMQMRMGRCSSST